MTLPRDLGRISHLEDHGLTACHDMRIEEAITKKAAQDATGNWYFGIGERMLGDDLFSTSSLATRTAELSIKNIKLFCFGFQLVGVSLDELPN